MNLKRYLLVGLLILTIALSYWIEGYREKSGLTPSPGVRLPDYTLEHATLIALDESGIPEYQIATPLMEHFKEDDTTELETPEMLFFRDEAPPTEVQSDRAKMLSGGDNILLLGNVTIVRPDDDASPLYTIITRDLEVFPKQESATTEQHVLAFSERYIIQGLGGSINLLSGKVKLYRFARGVYEP